MDSIIKLPQRLYSLLFIPIYHSILELLHFIRENFEVISKFIFISICSFALATLFGYYQLATWCLKWIGLGVMSSVGFGFGMHTFLLFLAPHIAAVTIAAHSCKSLNFPEPPYPHAIICPEQAAYGQVTFWMILSKIALESFMWGLGTSIGELPPYLVARFRAQSMDRNVSGDESRPDAKVAGWELWMIWLIRKVGFIGILVCAAIPNPLFDAAGVASGIAQVPFLTFFGATFIGKAIIKVFIQSSFVILLFHNNNLDSAISRIDIWLRDSIPILGDLGLHKRTSTFLEEQRTSVLKKQLNESTETSVLRILLNCIITTFMIVFIISIIVELDKRYKERKARETRKTK